MKKIILMIAFFTVMQLPAITVWKNGDQLLIRSKFSAGQDLVVEIFRYANENAWLIPRDKKISEYHSGTIIHGGTDDFPASNVGNYGYLSGNHGSPFARILTAENHGFTEKDTGKIFLDSQKRPYCLLNVTDKNTLFIHPVMTGSSAAPGFARHSKEKLFHDGKEIKFTASKMCQLYPSNRISRYDLLVDGKTPLPERQEVKCDFLDLVISYDVVSPGDLVDMFIKNPGKKIFPEFSGNYSMSLPGDRKCELYEQIPALLHYDVTIRHQDRGASVIYRTMEAKAPLTDVRGMDIMFIWNGKFASAGNQEFYIPKVNPVKLSGFGNDYGYFDFEKIVKFPVNMQLNCHLSRNYYSDLNNPPDRFIRLSGNGKRELGIALGYSLINGLSAQKKAWSAVRPTAYYFYRTSKMYPYVYTIPALSAGFKISTVSYKQYFDPAAEPDATSMYCHYEYDDLLVYLDFHKKLSGKQITLPEDAVNRTISIVEKTPGIRLHTAGKLQNTAIKLDNDADYGYIVLKLAR